MQLSIGFEALGYQLLQEKGISKNKAGASPFISRLRAIASELGDDWPFSLEQWELEMTESYNSIKYANRAPVDRLQSLNAWRKASWYFVVGLHCVWACPKTSCFSGCSLIR